MTDFQYKRAPITEAVVEFRFATPVNERKRNKGIKRLTRFYEDHNPVTQRNFELKINPDGTATTKTTDAIIDKLSSKDMTQQLHISDKKLLASQLAPYCGWEKFRLRITRDWDTWKNAVGFQPIERIGMRYINRIDLPVIGSLVHYEDYVTVYPSLPKMLDPSLNHSVNVRVLLTDIKSELTVRSAAVDSPLPDRLAIVLDLDIGRVFPQPPNYDELYSFMDQARAKKNEIFEACITDKARDLFD